MAKKVILTLAILAVVSLLGHWLYNIGQLKYTYTIDRLEKWVPIPIIYDNYTGTAIVLEGGDIKITWNHVLAPKGAFFTCLGTVGSDPNRFYVLELDGDLFLEKAQHIDPLIHALCALYRGGPGSNHPKTIAESLECLPSDVKVLKSLLLRFKKVAVDP